MAKLNFEGLAIGGAALAIGGAALYMYFRGAKGVGSDIGAGAVGAIGGAVSGAINATGEAFQDVSQATFGLEKTNTGKCEEAIRSGDKWAASFACPAGQFLGSMFSSKPKGDSVVYLSNPMTAPGGGIVPGADYSTYGTINDPRLDWSGATVVPTKFKTSEIEFFKLFDNWGQNWAPANAVPILPTKTANNGATMIVSVAGLRG